VNGRRYIRTGRGLSMARRKRVRKKSLDGGEGEKSADYRGPSTEKKRVLI